MRRISAALAFWSVAMKKTPLLAVTILLLTAAGSPAADQKIKILLIGKDRDHAYATHTYMDDCELLARCLRQTPGVETVVSNGWPKDPEALKNVRAIVLETRLGGTVLFRGPQRRQAEDMLKRGVGLTAIHWGTGAETPEGEPWLRAMGAWFNAERDGFSAYLVQTSKLHQVDPAHLVSRGWKDYDLREEYYFKLRFLPEARPVMTTVIKGATYPIGWVYKRPESQGGRSFGFVGGHFHENFGITEFRQSVVNGILWTAHVDIPENGAPCRITAKDMELAPDPPRKK
jgi:type 1 glutamine amidotransferase